MSNRRRACSLARSVRPSVWPVPWGKNRRAGCYFAETDMHKPLLCPRHTSLPCRGAAGLLQPSTCCSATTLTTPHPLCHRSSPPLPIPCPVAHPHRGAAGLLHLQPAALLRPPGRRGRGGAARVRAVHGAAGGGHLQGGHCLLVRLLAGWLACISIFLGVRRCVAVRGCMALVGRAGACSWGTPHTRWVCWRVVVGWGGVRWGGVRRAGMGAGVLWECCDGVMCACRARVQRCWAWVRCTHTRSPLPPPAPGARGVGAAAAGQHPPAAQPGAGERGAAHGGGVDAVRGRGRPAPRGLRAAGLWGDHRHGL